MSGSEFSFELRLCAWAERRWDDESSFVARQLGTQRRRWDTVVVECDPAGLRQRARFGANHLDWDLRYVLQHAPAEWAWYRDVVPDPGYAWRYVLRAIHRGAGRGVLEKRRRNGNRVEIRRKWPYPDWVDRIIAIENKPDLDASAARALSDQLERDVALGLADEVWLATEATGGTVEPALLESMPVEVGILAFDPESGDADVLWHPRSLSPDRPGTRIESRGDPCEFEYADPEWKADRRLGIAERAYERGWRSYADTMRPDCRYFALRRANEGHVPYCVAKDREQTAAECSGSCPEFQPEPPQWRTRGWPVEGGPGKAVKRLLDRRRRRQRPGLDDEA